MSRLKIIAAVVLLCAVSAVSFYGGREYEAYYYNFDNLFEVHQELKDSCEKNYEAACLQATFIKYLVEHFEGETECFNIGAEIENCYEGWFGELNNGNFNTKYIKDIKDLDVYSQHY